MIGLGLKIASSQPKLTHEHPKVSIKIKDFNNITYSDRTKFFLKMVIFTNDSFVLLWFSDFEPKGIIDIK